MAIEPEPSDGWFPFLEAVICLPPTGPLAIRFKHDNWDAYVATGRIGKLTIQHRRTFMDERTACLLYTSDAADE